MAKVGLGLHLSLHCPLKFNKFDLFAFVWQGTLPALQATVGQYTTSGSGDGHSRHFHCMHPFARKPVASQPSLHVWCLLLQCACFTHQLAANLSKADNGQASADLWQCPSGYVEKSLKNDRARFQCSDLLSCFSLFLCLQVPTKQQTNSFS